MPDLAILVRDLVLDDALRWLDRECGPVAVAASPEPPLSFYDVGPHRLVITSGIEGGSFSELLFPGGSRWSNSAAFARAAAAALGRETLYEPPDSDPYDWRSVSADGVESDVVWIDGPEPRAV